MTHARREAVLKAAQEHAEAMLVTAQVNVRYLTGFTGSNGQLLLASSPVFLTDGRYTEQAAAQVPDVDRVIYGAEGSHAALAAALRERGIRRLAVEAGDLTVDAHARLAAKLEGVELVATTEILERVRLRKSPEEIDAIRRAQRVAEKALTDALTSFAGGTERDLALAIEWNMRTGGAEAVSFDLIVATGAHAALPHATPRDAWEDSGVLLVDIGAKVDGYCSDMTRTYLSGGAPGEVVRAHEACVRAVEAACAAVRAGVNASVVDKAARDCLAAEGLAEFFVHSTGHGVGLDIHESPRLSQVSEAVLEPGMVITVEPGVYLPGAGGVRVEDLLVVTEDGYENLTALPRGPRPPV